MSTNESTHDHRASAHSTRMRACVISQNDELAAILPELEGVAWMSARPGMPIPDASLYIWDFNQNIQIPNKILAQEDIQHLLLAELGDLEAQDHVCFSRAVGIMLKPITPYTLRAFVEMAFKTWALRQQAREVDTLRYDRNMLLQYVLEVNLKLQEYDYERSNFLARALHDLRTPLTALHGYCGLLSEGKLGPVSANQRELLERMSYSTRRLGRLASATCDLLSQGRVQMLPQVAVDDIGACVSRALHDVYPFLQDKNIEVTTQIEVPDQAFYFEAEQIEQVLINLLENACKFTQPNGTIKIFGSPVAWNFSAKSTPELEAQAGQSVNAYRINVLDSGTGIPEYWAEKIFEQYASYSDPLDRSGGGLGLAICRRIITAHRGLIWATPSERGGLFSFVLPLLPSFAGGSPALCRTGVQSSFTFAEVKS